MIRSPLGERNYHVFYQFLDAATTEERSYLGLNGLGVGNFKLLNGSGGTVGRRDGVVDGDLHKEMLDAMVSSILLLYSLLSFISKTAARITYSCIIVSITRQVTIGFDSKTIASLLRVITAILHCGNITFMATYQSDSHSMSDACSMEKTHASVTAAK